MRWFARGIGAAIFAAAIGPAALADSANQCRDLEGPFSSVLVAPPQCTSVVGLCTHGVLVGDLEADYDFTATALYPVDDPDHPGRLHYLGTSVITPNNGAGQMFSDDYGDLDPAGPNAYFATHVQVIRGTKNDKKTVGSLVASGELSFITGEATGSYSGTFCHENDHK
jgi:hypothetical protein